MTLKIQSAILTTFSLCIIISIVIAQTTPTTTASQSRSRPNLAPKLKQKQQQTTAPTTINDQKKQNNGRSNNGTNNSNLRERSVTNNSSVSTGRLEFVEDELPADFYEMPPEQLDLGMNATGRAPVPMLNVAVLQNGQMIDSAINVHPGTPLEMVIYLDDKSAKVYGLLASYLKVQDDTFRQREEVIILNGCSIDTYIFGNFEQNPDDQSLRAKFRAFKFPDSNLVRFVGTVNVCIKQCAKVNCNGGRKKRASHNTNNKDDRLVSLTVSTVLRISNPVQEIQRAR